MHCCNPLCFFHVATVLLLIAGAYAALFAAASTDTFIYAGCSPSRYNPGTPFESNLKSLLTSITSAAPNELYNSFTPGANGTAGDASAPAYGLYQCRGDMDSSSGCASCVRSCLAQLDTVCPAAYAASLQLDGCYVRYDTTDFVGQLHTAMVYRKCSTSTSGDAGFLKNRDAVTADLQQGVVNGFKTSSAADVRGVAQCLGDLAVADCAACLGQAVGQLKGVCGTALAADVYLAQCYVRYWADGYHFRPTQDYSQDDVGKTIAIAIGICSGLALLVIFVSFLRKTC
ncbi:hypothetical protein QOZ80_4BG0340160 [Eleusine coracana subsp. coracana]|nr:hypothetical protein QOZ80_4BG0340160 [Eleusine coracana subsp. coracana]